MEYLIYFKNVSNIYDLEFFLNKLTSSAFTISNVERMVMSGVPFWEEDEAAVLNDMEESTDDNEQQDIDQQTDENQFDQDGHRPLRNVLAEKVTEKLANEKREKLQLLQDLESIKEKFSKYYDIMMKQEMSTSIKRAGAFMGEIH